MTAIAIYLYLAGAVLSYYALSDEIQFDENTEAGSKQIDYDFTTKLISALLWPFAVPIAIALELRERYFR